MLKNLLLLTVSTALAVALLEVALRVLMPERLAFVPVLMNNALTYEPNQIQRWRHLEWDYEIRINADGFRNDRTLDALPAGSVLALGDSFTEGYGVALADAYPKRLEARLRERGGAPHVYNAGHYDTGLPYYRRVYRDVFRTQRAITSVVIGVFVGNDTIRNARPPDGRLTIGNEFGDGWRYRLKAFLGSHVATYAVLNHVVKTNPALFALCKRLGACYRPRPPNIYSEALLNRAIPHTVAFVAAFVAEIAADGRDTVVVLVPTREQTDDALWQRVVAEYGPEADTRRFALNEGLAAGLTEAGVRVLDLSGPMLEHRRLTGERLYFRYDGHWNPRGHAFAAEALAAFLDTAPRSARHRSAWFRDRNGE